MYFLYNERGLGKIYIKPSEEGEHMEALIPGPEVESYDSDLELEKYEENSDHESDSDCGKSNSDEGSNDDRKVIVIFK